MARKIIRVANGTDLKITQESLRLKKTAKYYLNVQRIGEKIFVFIIIEDVVDGKTSYFSLEFKPPFGKNGITLDNSGILDLPSGEKIFTGDPSRNRLKEKIRNNTSVCFDFTSIKGFLIIYLKSLHSKKKLLTAKAPLKDIGSFLEVENEKT